MRTTTITLLGSRPSPSESRRVGLEPREVVLLLHAWIATHLACSCAEPIEPLVWNRIGYDDTRRRPATEAVLDACELVVEGVGRRDPERARRERELVRRVRQRELEAALSRPPAESGNPRGHRARLAPGTRAAVGRPDDLVPDPVQPEELDRLRVVSGGHVDVVPAALENRDQRTKERHLG